MSWINVISWGTGLGMGWAMSRLLDRIPQAADPLPASSDAQATIGQLQADLLQTQLAYQMATEISQFKASFLGRTSHELRSPLNAVISLHQLILSDLCDDAAEEREFVAQANDAATKMLARLDELIQVSKVESGSTPLEIQPLQLASVLEEIRQLTYLQSQNRNLRLDIQPPDPQVYILADPRWLRQVLLNLVTSPIALMQEGNIRISTQVLPEAGKVKILVEDECPAANATVSPPIAPAHQELPSTTAHRSMATLPKSDFPSPGLNLAINQTLMHLMQGELEVLSPSAVAVSSPAAVATQTQVTQVCCSLPLVTSELE